LFGSGLLGLIDATSNVESAAMAAGGAAGSCADAALAASRTAKTKAHVGRSIIELSFMYVERG
jgi:hypothetical protein